MASEWLLKLTYLLMPVCSLRMANDLSTPPFSIRGQTLHFSPGVSHLLRFFFRVSLPGVSWPTSSPLPWGVPCDSLTGDGFWRFPIHLHFLFFITFSMGSCLVIFQSVVLDTLSVHFRCRILRGYLLMKVCILFSVFCVLRHVSDPCSKTAFTFEFNILKLRSTTISCSCSLPQA